MYRRGEEYKDQEGVFIGQESQNLGKQFASSALPTLQRVANETDSQSVYVYEIQMVIRKKVNSGYMVDNVLMRYGGAYVGNEGDKREGLCEEEFKHEEDLKMISIKALMLLTSLPSSYDNFVETLLYGRELITLEDKYYVKRNKKKSTSFVKKNVGQGSGMHYEDYDNDDLLMAVSKDMFLECIMDFGGSYQMSPERDFLFDFNESNTGCALHSRVENKFDIFGHSGSSGLYHEVAEYNNKGDKGFFDGLVRNYEEKLSWRLDDVKQEIIISIDVVYDENLIYTDTLKGAGAEYSGKEVEFELELQESRLSKGLQALKTKVQRKVGSSGFVQRVGIDYNEVFLSMVRHASIRVILLLFACEDYQLEHIDVETAFLYDDMLISYKIKSEVEYTKGLLRKEFDMKGMGPTMKIIGTRITKDRGSTLQGIMYSRYQGKHVDVDVSWKATMQHVVALSIIEAEYMALTKANKQSINEAGGGQTLKLDRNSSNKAEGSPLVKISAY
ncbi:retrovirus-related pol polyprotein from transposon TNT 1-94 [Tanacetum coccineum]